MDGVVDAAAAAVEVRDTEDRVEVALTERLIESALEDECKEA